MTAQMPDRIIIDGVEHALLETPLDDLLPDLAGVPELVPPHTANWRGYVARWRVSDDRLYLDDVHGWVGSDAEEVGHEVVLPGVELPRLAWWVDGSLRVGVGDVARYVHAGFESRYERELVLDVHEGVITERRELAAAGAMGMAGPYRLDEPLSSSLSGGGFGQVIAASDLDGRPLVAKAPRPTGGAASGTEMWAGSRPVHVPARAFAAITGGLVARSVDASVTEAVLRLEADVLERDGGMLLPRSFGIWDHDPSGIPVLVMERLEGHTAESAPDVRAVLAAVADAVDRGTFDAHGDLKFEHVFIADGSVRLCDPAPRFSDPDLRAFTAAYNPHGWQGPAADAVACASMLRYLADPPEAIATWTAELLDVAEPPAWAVDHRDALARLDSAVAAGPGTGARGGI